MLSAKTRSTQHHKKGGARHAYVVDGLELVKRLDQRHEALGIDLQLVLPVGIQRDSPGITTRTVTAEPELSVGEHYGTDRRL